MSYNDLFSKSIEELCELVQSDYFDTLCEEEQDNITRQIANIAYGDVKGLPFDEFLKKVITDEFSDCENEEVVLMVGGRQEVVGTDRIGNFTVDGERFIVYVNTDDSGREPHFHISNAGFHSAIKIETAEYYFHEGRRCDALDESRTDELCEKQKKVLMKFFEGKTDIHLTKWYRVVDSWNRNNDDNRNDLFLYVPDYMRL